LDIEDERTKTAKPLAEEQEYLILKHSAHL